MTNDSTEFENIYHNNYVGKASFDSLGMRWEVAGMKKSSTIVIANRIKKIECVGSAKKFALRFFEKLTETSDESAIKIFTGFRKNNIKEIKEEFLTKWGVDFEDFPVSLKGWNVGKLKMKSHSLEFNDGSERCFDIPFKRMDQCFNIKNDLVMELRNEEMAFEHEMISEIRFHIPMPKPMDSFLIEDNEPKTASELAQDVREKAKLFFNAEEGLVEFKDVKFLTPRGKYELVLTDEKMFLRGKAHSFKMSFKDLTKMFLLPKNDDGHFLIISLKKPINKGKTFHNFLIIGFKDADKTEAIMNITKADLEKKYNSKLTKELEGPSFKIITRVIKTLSSTRVFMPGTFKSNDDRKFLRCAIGASQGYLYPLEASFVFCQKPVLYIQHRDIYEIEFLRVVDSLANTKMFEMLIKIKPSKSPSKGRGKEANRFLFTGLLKNEFSSLFKFLSSKNIRIANKEDHEERLSSKAAGNRSAYTKKRKIVDLPSEYSSSGEEFDVNEEEKQKSQQSDNSKEASEGN